MKNILISGATGFIGQRLVGAVDANIRVLSREKQPNYETVVCDFEKEDIKYPIGEVAYSQDALHRKHTIDTQIKLFLEAKERDIEIIFFETYFDKVGSKKGKQKLTAKTKVPVRSSQ